MKPVLTLVLLLLSFTVVHAQPGTLDSSFGTNGKTSVCVGYDGYHQGAREMALQPDGKLVTVGNTYIDWVRPDRPLLVRLLRHGQFDPGVAVEGRVPPAYNLAASFGDGNSRFAQPDGQLL